MKEKHLTTRNMPLSERPYEKCELHGPESLSDAELLAVIIRTGTKEERAVDVAARILNASRQEQNLLGLYSMSMEELRSISGIGRVKAVQLQCVGEISKRIAKTSRQSGLIFSTPQKIAEYYMEEMRHLTREKVIILLLDSKSKMLKEMTLFTGSVNASMMAPREVYETALRYNAVYIILLHNHPSGDPTPSKEDVLATKRLEEAGKIIGIPMMDHIIIGDNKYISFKKEGLL